MAICTISMVLAPRERITKMKLSTIAACFVATLCLSTSAADHTYNGSATHYAEHQADEHGSMLKLTLPGTITIPVRWNANLIRLDFGIFPYHIEIRDQHGGRGSAKIERVTYESLRHISVRKGTGVFGPTDLKSVRITN